MALIDLVTRQAKKMSFAPGDALKVGLSAATPTAMLAQTKNILKEIAQHVNPGSH
jgi:hypothetical protein